MSLIKKSEFKNHSSANHRTEIHLTYHESQSDATGFALEEVAVDDPKASDPVGNAAIAPTDKPQIGPTGTYKSA